jgi:hypothetical protein
MGRSTVHGAFYSSTQSFSSIVVNPVDSSLLILHPHIPVSFEAHTPAIRLDDGAERYLTRCEFEDTAEDRRDDNERDEDTLDEEVHDRV